MNNPELEKMQTKNNQILTEWVNSYTEELYRWASTKVREQELAEDLVQDTFISALQALDKFEERSSPKTWLFAILNNKIAEHFRKEKRASLVFHRPTEWEAEKHTDGLFSENGAWSKDGLDFVMNQDSHLLDREDFSKLLAMCLDDLPEKWNKAITLKYLFEKDAEDICQELGVSITNYWQIIHRCKVLLRKCLEKYWRDE